MWIRCKNEACKFLRSFETTVSRAYCCSACKQHAYRLRKKADQRVGPTTLNASTKIGIAVHIPGESGTSEPWPQGFTVEEAFCRYSKSDLGLTATPRRSIDETS